MLFFKALQVYIWEILSDIFEAHHLGDQHHHGPTEGLDDAKLAFTVIGKSDVLFCHSHRVLPTIYQNFGTIATLLTALLKKDGFC
jgi:hypothetical protein